MTNTIKEKNLILKIIPSLFLIVSLLCMQAGISYAWLSQNMKLDVKNMEISASEIKPMISVAVDSYDITSTGAITTAASITSEAVAYSSNAAIITLSGINLKVPGDYCEVHITVENAGEQPFTVDKYGLCAGIEESNSNGYYLGTQLEASVGGDFYRLATDGGIYNDIIFNSSSVSAITSGGACTYTFKIEFVNDINNSQDVYKHFGTLKDDGTPDGVCSRKLLVICNPYYD